MDMKTVLISYLITNAICAGVIGVLYWQNRKQFKGLGFWLADFVMQFAGLLLVFMRGVMSDFISMVVGNGLAIGGTILLYMGLERFLEKRGPQWHNTLLFIFFISIHSFFTVVSPNLTARNINFASTVFVICAQCVWLLLHRVDVKLRPITRDAGLVFAAYCLVNAGRIFVDLAIPSGDNLLNLGLYDTAAVMIYQMLFIALTFSLFLTVNHRLLMELQEDITERNQTEKALYESETTLQEVLHSTADGILAVNKENKVLYMNKRFAELWQIPQDILNKRDDVVLLQYVLDQLSDPQGFIQKVQELYDSSAEDLETLAFKDGRIFERLSHPMMQGDQINGRVWSFRDITERKRIEEALIKSQQMYQDLVERQGIGVYRIRVQKHFSWGEPEQPHYEYEFINDEYCRLTGASREEHFADPTLTLKMIHPEDFPSFAKKNEEVDITNEPFVWEGRMIVRGEVRWMHYESRSRNFPDVGEVWTGILMDITERKLAEEELRESKALYDSLVNQLPQNLYRIDRDGKVLFVNKMLQQNLGAPLEDILGKIAYELYTEDKARQYRTEDAQVIASGKSLHLVDVNKSPVTGQVSYTEGIKIPVFDKDGKVCGIQGIFYDITERKQGEDALRLSEERYRNFIAQSFEAISRTEFDHPIDITLPVEEQIDSIYENAFMAECNQAMADMYHVPSPEAFIGMRLLDAHGGKDNPVNRNVFKKLIENGYKSTNDETIEYTADGETIWFLSNTIGTVENGFLVRLWGTAIDITERKRAEAALRASETSMRSLIENVKDVFVRYDPDLRFQYASPMIQTILGTPPESFIGKTHREAGFPEDKAEFFDTSLRQAIQSKKPLDVEFSLQGRDGEYIMHTRVYPELNEQGEVISVVTVTSDITERKHMEEALARSQGLYQDLVERQVVGVYRIRIQRYSSWGMPDEPHYEYEFMNDEYCRLTGVSREEHFADPSLTLKLIHPEDYPSFAQKNEEVDATLEPFAWEGRMIIRGETRWVHYESCSRQIPGKYVVWTGVLMDITERRLAEELIRMRLRLIEYANDHSIEELLQEALDEICLFTNSPIGFYHFIEPDQKTISLQAWSTRTLTEFCRTEGKGIHYDIDQAGVWVDCFHQRKPVIHNDYASLPHRKGLPLDHAEVKRELVVPILREGNVVSILGIGNKPSNYNEKDSEYVSYVADIVWTIVERKQVAEALQQAIETLHTQLIEIHALKETLQEQAIRDPLTNLHNRRYLDETLEHEVARAKRENYPLSIMMIDIDYFKNFNDTYGHSAGDEVLKSASRLLVASIRQGDIACRHGGEEFLIVMVGAHEADVERRAEAIRSDFSRLRIRFDKTELSATISIGVAFYPRHGTEIQQVIGAADTAMYLAKQAGRNRIQVWQEGE